MVILLSAVLIIICILAVGVFCLRDFLYSSLMPSMNGINDELKQLNINSEVVLKKSLLQKIHVHYILPNKNKMHKDRFDELILNDMNDFYTVSTPGYLKPQIPYQYEMNLNKLESIDEFKQLDRSFNQFLYIKNYTGERVSLDYFYREHERLYIGNGIEDKKGLVIAFMDYISPSTIIVNHGGMLIPYNTRNLNETGNAIGVSKKDYLLLQDLQESKKRTAS